MDRPDPKFTAAFEVCLSCEALERAQREQAKKDRDDALPSARVWRVYDADEVAELAGAGRAQRSR